LKRERHDFRDEPASQMFWEIAQKVSLHRGRPRAAAHATYGTVALRFVEAVDGIRKVLGEIFQDLALASSEQ
jgi:hypothetical protein